MQTRFLFVCLGNICRSPTAHAVFEHAVEQAGAAPRVQVDSAGTGDWHIGRAPDPRAVEAAARRGYRMETLRARQVTAADFYRFDRILAMDRSNLQDLQALSPEDASVEPQLFLEYGRKGGALEVPDPYYGGEDGFEAVLDLIEDAARGLLESLLKEERKR